MWAEMAGRSDIDWIGRAQAISGSGMQDLERQQIALATLSACLAAAGSAAMKSGLF